MWLRRLFPLLPLSALMAFSIANIGLTGDDATDQPSAAQQAGPSLSVPSCTTVAVGETFALSVFASNLEDLLAWEVYIGYDRDVLEVTRRDVNQLLSLAEGSRVFDFSDPVPNSKGLYRMAAADLGSAASAETGSGLLAVITFRAKRSGVSPTAITEAQDLDGDDLADIGPTITSIGGEHFGDVNGDGFFDGAIASGQVAVDTACVTPLPEPSPPIDFPIQDVTPEPGDSPPDGETDGSGDGASPDSTPADIVVDGETDGGIADGGVSPQDLTATPGGPDTATPVASPTPAGGAPTPSNPSTSGGGLPTWLIAVISVAAAAGLVTALAIMRAARRRPV